MLYLRTRYGSAIDLLTGIAGYWRAVLLHPGVTGHRQTLIANFFQFVRNWLYFARTSGRRRHFYGSEYALHRDGAYREIKRVRGNDPSLPLVSVLIRTMGKQRLLRDAILSVRNQTYTAIEVVLVEDGPRTLDRFIAEFSDLRIQYVALGERQGRCRAGNVALKQAQGEYFVFLDDDDLFFADHIEQLILAIHEAGAECKVAYSYSFELPTEFADDGETIARLGRMRPHYRQPFVYLKLLLENYIPILNVLFHRSLYEQHGGFTEHLDNLEDWNLWVRYASTARPFIVVPKTTAVYRVPMSKAVQKQRAASFRSYYPLALEANRAVAAPLRASDFIEVATYGENVRLRRWLRILLRRML
jgi:glycosyltransferase involved in cell wall biosynthesis